MIDEQPRRRNSAMPAMPPSYDASKFYLSASAAESALSPQHGATVDGEYSSPMYERVEEDDENDLGSASTSTAAAAATATARDRKFEPTYFRWNAVMQRGGSRRMSLDVVNGGLLHVQTAAELDAEVS
jgi:hypothetical protein